MQAAVKTTTFKEIWVQEGRPAPDDLELVFIHGLEGPSRKTQPLRRRLKARLQEKKPSGIYRLSVFGFNAALLLNGGTEAFVSTADTLLKAIAKLKGDRSVIFVAHGIAGWIVQEAIASYGDLAVQVLRRTIGIIMLGLPQCHSKSEWNEFQTLFLDTVLRSDKHEPAPVNAVSGRKPSLVSRLSRGSKRSAPLDFELLQLVDENFAAIRRCVYSPRVEYLQHFPSDNQDQPILLIHPSTTLSSSTTSSKELSPKQLVQLSLLDIEPGDENDKKITSLLSSRMADETPNQLGSHFTDPSTVGKAQDATTNPYSRTTKATHRNDSMNQSEILSSSPRLPAHRPISPTPAVIPSANSTKQDVKPALRPRGQNIDLINPSTDDQQPNLMLTTLNEQEAKLFKLGLELGDSVGNVSTRETSIHSGVLNDSKLMDSKLAPVRQYSTTEKERLGEFEDGKLRLADTYHQSGEMQKARALYVECRIMMSRTLIDMQTERIIRIDCRIAELCLHEGKYVEAQAGFEALEKRALANYPPKGLRCWEIGRWMGIVHDKQGKYKAAQEKLSSINQAMEDTEWHDDDTKDEFEANVLMTKNALSLTCGHAGDFVQAIAINDKALALAENSGRTFRMSPIQLNRAAIYAYHERYKEAEDQNVKALNNMEKHLGPNHVKTLDCRSLEAHLLAVDGQLKEAEERCQATLKRMRETLGKDHPGTLQALGTLVLVYKAKGRLADALQTALRLVDSCKTSPALGRNHPQTIRANRALASVYSARGELYQAIELQKEVVDVSAATESGPNHPTALSYRSDLANMYCQNEEWETANDMAYEVFVKQCRNFVSEFEPGEKAQKADILAKSDEARVALRVLLDQLCEHLNQNRHVRCPMSLLSTMDCLGISERDKENGNLELARTILAHVTSYRQGMLAAHPDTLSSQFELAKTKRLAGDLEAAAEDFQAVLFGRLKVLGDDHPDTLTARHELNVTWFQLGEHEEATWELEMTLKVRKNLLGETHPDIIRSEVQIASLYHSVGRLGKAEALLFAALNSQLQIYGLHRLDNKTLDGRSLWYREALQPIEKQLQVLEGWNRPSGISKLTGEPKYYPDVVSSLASLASIYVDRGDAADLDKAVAIQSAVVSLQENSLSPDALITLQSINDFALTLQARGTLEGNTSQQDMDQAKAMYERIIKANPVSDTLLLKCKSNLASLFFACNELPQAEQTLTEVLDSYRDPNVDPEAILASMFNLALTKKELNKADEALQLMQAVVERTRYALGAKHPQSIQMAQTLEEWREEIDLESKEEQGMSGKGTKVEEMDKASLLGESKHSTEAGHSDHR